MQPESTINFMFRSTFANSSFIYTRVLIIVTSMQLIYTHEPRPVFQYQLKLS